MAKNSDPAVGAYSVTASDTVDFTIRGKVCRGLNVATSGTYKITTNAGEDVSIYIAAGIAFPISAVRVWATGSDSTSGIVALY